MHCLFILLPNADRRATFRLSIIIKWSVPAGSMCLGKGHPFSVNETNSEICTCHGCLTHVSEYFHCTIFSSERKCTCKISE